MISKCGHCGGNVKMIACAGRTAKYKGVTLAVPATFEIATCEKCGEEYMNAEECDKLDEALEWIR